MNNIEELKNELSKLENEKKKIEKLLKPINKRIKDINKLFEDTVNVDLFPKICNKIDELFNLEENKDCNIIILNGIHRDESGIYICYNTSWGETDYVEIDKKLSTGDYENNWATAIQYSEDNDKILKEIIKLSKKYIPSSEKIYGDDEGVNCYWHGIVALHKDHTVVGFICRDDNFMLNDYVNTPDILFDFNKL